MLIAASTTCRRSRPATRALRPRRRNCCAAIADAFPGTTTSITYGSTEAGTVCRLWSEDLFRKPGSVGLPAMGSEVRLAENGEILVRNDMLMNGYFRDPEATAAALEGGWFHTGRPGRAGRRGLLLHRRAGRGRHPHRRRGRGPGRGRSRPAGCARGGRRRGGGHARRELGRGRSAPSSCHGLVRRSTWRRSGATARAGWPRSSTHDGSWSSTPCPARGRRGRSSAASSSNGPHEKPRPRPLPDQGAESPA